MPSVSQQIREAAGVAADSLVAVENGADDPATAPALMPRFDDDRLMAFITDAAAARAEFDLLMAVGAGLIAKRSDRALGYQGLAARQGHRSAGNLVQALTGLPSAEAWRLVHLGEAIGKAEAATALRDAASDQQGVPSDGPANESSDDEAEAGDFLDPQTPAGQPGVDEPADVLDQAEAPRGPEPPDQIRPVPVEMPWSEPITRAVTEHVLTPQAASALIRGLGQPSASCDADVLREAAAHLVASAAGASVEELTKRARCLRDSLDPVGVSERAARHFDARKARLGTNSSGARTVWLECDDEAGAWFDTIIGAGMRPRRGGPRFVDKAEADAAEALRNDPRTNEQIMFDLIMGTLRTGALADSKTVFGSRQAGLRVIVTKEQVNKRDADGNLTGTGYLEDTGEAVAPETIEHLLCDTGTVEVTFDQNHNPLDAGREHRLFTPKQRLALALRDGGCMDPDCDRPPSYAEAHHIDHYVEHHGRTDIADGILLCRYHHMLLHNQHWRIRRKGNEYWLHFSEGDPRPPVRLRRKAAWWVNQQAG